MTVEGERWSERPGLAYVRIDTDAGIYGVAGHEFYPQGPGLGAELQDWVVD